MAVLLLPVCQYVVGQTVAGPKKLVDSTFMEMESVGGPNISPDGKYILFSRTWIDQVADQSRSSIWLFNTQNERVSELTHGDWHDTNPVWSPDGSRVGYLSDRDGTSQLNVMWFDTREVAQLTRLERTPGNFKWSSDSKQIVFTNFVPRKDPPLKIELPSGPKGAKRADPAVIVDRLSWQSDGTGYREPGFTHLFTIDAVLGGTPRQVTSGDFNHSDPEWSKDGKKLFCTAIRKPDAEYLRNDSEVYEIDLQNLEVKPLTEREGPDGNAVLSHDGKWIAYTGYDQQKFTSHLASVYLMDSQGENKRLLLGGLSSSPANVQWASDDSGVYYEMEQRGSRELHFVSVEGTHRSITNGIHTLSGITISDQGDVAAVRSTPQVPGELVSFQVADPANIKSLVNVNNDALRDVQLGEVEELLFKSSDGLDVQGWLVKPAGFDPEKKYPLVLWIHGGPWSMYSVGFNWGFQNFAANGYAVLYTNPRGSTGYGQDFVNGIQYSYPGRDYDDLMAGVDAALSKGWIDDQNMFVCGGSGGGVLTAWIVGHTDRFAGACSMRPVINWHSFVGTTDGPSWYDQFRRYPWEDPLEYSARSPLSFVANVTTPTMVMTGEADLRTPMTQSEEYYRALKLLKKETLLVRVPEEYHGWRRPSHQLMQQLYLREWFKKWTRPLEKEKATGDRPTASESK